MSRLPAAHVNHFHIVVCVLRKMYEAGVGPDGNEPACLQKLVTVNDHVLPVHVQGPVNIRTAFQYLLFFFRNDA